MKKIYSYPLAELLYIERRDVISDSLITDTNNPDGDNDNGGWGEIFPSPRG